MTEFFRQLFGHSPDLTVFVPGRVNLIGEHIDYNGGCVLPHALHHGVTVSLTPRADKAINVGSNRFEGLSQSTIGNPSALPWARYAQATVQLAYDLGWITGGADVAILSDLHDGAGLSSSAAICVGILKALRQVSATEVTDVDIAQLARRVENEAIGVPCGIMDQMAVAIAQSGEALFLNTATLTYESIRLPQDIRFIVIHSGMHRELAEGHYKARKEECDIAKEAFGTEDLCHLSEEELEAKEGLPGPVRKRVRHCITEHARTVTAAACLRQGDMTAFGRLMRTSHQSMRDDFEMSLPVIDALVETCLREGALGARLTGGGFGGCIVAAVKREQTDLWTARVLSQHPQAFRVE